jgi:hypothetical protein
MSGVKLDYEILPPAHDRWRVLIMTIWTLLIAAIVLVGLFALYLFVGFQLGWIDGN